MPATKVCRVCGEEKPAYAFEAGRRQCRQCRQGRRSNETRGSRERSTRSTDEEPHPVPATGQTGGRGKRRLESDRRWSDARRKLIEEAPATATLEERGGQVFRVLRLASQVEPTPTT